MLLVSCFSLQYGAAQPAPLQNGRQAELADPQQAWWFYRPERVESEKPEELLDILEIKAGDVVADIGAGPGFFPSALPSASDRRERFSRWMSSSAARSLRGDGFIGLLCGWLESSRA